MSYLAQITVIADGRIGSTEIEVESSAELERQFEITCEEFAKVHASCLDLDACFATDAFYR